MAQIVQPYTTVSDRVRALDAAGVARADIAKFLGKRYQHVRNVLEGDKQRGGHALGHADPSGVQENGATFARPTDDGGLVEARGAGAYRLVVRPDGSVMLPKEILTAFGVEHGGVVMAKLDADTFCLISTDTAIKRVRELVRQYIPPGVDLIAQLITDRRAEAEREESGD